MPSPMELAQMAIDEGVGIGASAIADAIDKARREERKAIAPGAPLRTWWQRLSGCDTKYV